MATRRKPASSSVPNATPSSAATTNAVQEKSKDVQLPTDPLVSDVPHSGSVIQLLVCVAGIYISFLTWALLQERITTTSYGPDKRIFRYPLVLNTVQSLFASLTGYLYLRYTTKAGASTAPIFPNKDITSKLLLVAVCQSLASPFGYASLQHIDYITFILAKSCKLLPVMALHLTIFRRSYPFYKYAVVASVTAGVAVFTLYHPSGNKKGKGAETSSAWGLMLLGINLLFDGLTNSMQDHIFVKNKTFKGPQMMCALNAVSTLLTTGYLLLNPWTNELGSALDFMGAHPQVFRDVLGFAACGALGQVFIFHTLSQFGSLVLVTVTVTRKMFSMILSVVAFGHSLTPMQWFGVSLVFGGIGAEAEIKRRSEVAKKAATKAALDTITNGVKKE
ncbi:UAA transporter [Ascobolus immersus RN42]|uniref:UDP-galactose transporter homolog 1 n=1 Tax=Ascobolus immersus RN42 TaxID=1160509 RepID=A0A3N4ICB8_ASCIM|nr:UAA transporter [Ascobolus immersus RN42]